MVKSNNVNPLLNRFAGLRDSGVQNATAAAIAVTGEDDGSRFFNVAIAEFKQH